MIAVEKETVCSLCRWSNYCWKCVYRLTVAVTKIVTNSATEICIVKLFSGKKCKITSTGHEEVWGRVEVWLLSLIYAPVNGQWLNDRVDRSFWFQRQTGSSRWQYPVVYFLLLNCHVTWQTQHYRNNILTVYSTPLHISAVNWIEVKWSEGSGGVGRVVKLELMGKFYMSSEVMKSEGLGWKCEKSMVGKNTRNYIQYFLTLVFFNFLLIYLWCLGCIIINCLVCIVVVVLCVLLRFSCLYCCNLMCNCCTMCVLLFLL